METIEVKNLWGRIQNALGYVTNPFNLSSHSEDKFLINGVELCFWGENTRKAVMCVGDDLENTIEVWNSEGGLKWAWRNLKERGII